MEFLKIAWEYYWLHFFSKLTTTYVANCLIYLAGALWGIELIPQVIKTLKTKNVRNISLAFFIIGFIAYIIYDIGNIMLGNWNIVIAHIPSLILFLTMLILILKYRRKK